MKGGQVLARKKELSEEERKKELIRKLKKGPDLEKYLEGRKRTFVSYAQGARMYSMSYYTFIKFAKEAGANIHIKKNVVVDVGAIEAYIQKNREGGPNSNEK
ncbi:MAG: hypothetical protein K5989_12040, partial [Lachnospiraceae bacterium]|nr:hypothetical protein [Lachnospiraceae bacterium]